MKPTRAAEFGPIDYRQTYIKRNSEWLIVSLRIIVTEKTLAITLLIGWIWLSEVQDVDNRVQTFDWTWTRGPDAQLE